MQSRALLEQIWSGAVTAFDASGSGEIARGVRALLPVRTISLKNADDHVMPRILSEAEELMPGVTLGDVISEELGIDVPFGALVVFEEVGNPTDNKEVSGDTQGREAAILQHLAPARAARMAEREGKARGATAVAAPSFRDGALNQHFFGAQLGAEVCGDAPAQVSR